MFGILLTFVFAAAGLALIGYACWSAIRSSVAGKWPVTPAQIESCSLTNEVDSDGATIYEVKVRYTYAVDGKQFAGTRLAFCYIASSGRDTHRQICTKLQQAKAIDVRFDPNDPSISTLSFGIHRSIRMLFAIGVTLLVFVAGFSFSVTFVAFVTGLAATLWICTRRDDVLLRNLIVR